MCNAGHTVAMAGLLMLAACGGDPGGPLPDGGGGACFEASCAAVCAHIVAAGCHTGGATFMDQAACERACAGERDKTTSGCRCAFERYLTCVATAAITCPSERCVQGTCETGGGTAAGCERVLEELESCTRVCPDPRAPVVEVNGVPVDAGAAVDCR